MRRNVRASAAVLVGSQDDGDSQAAQAWRQQTMREVAQFIGPALLIPLGDPLMSVVDTVAIGQASRGTVLLAGYSFSYSYRYALGRGLTGPSQITELATCITSRLWASRLWASRLAVCEVAGHATAVALDWPGMARAHECYRQPARARMHMHPAC